MLTRLDTNPIKLGIRLVGALLAWQVAVWAWSAVVAGYEWLTWVMPQGDAWEWASLAGFSLLVAAAMVLLGYLAISALVAPTRTHLALISLVGVFFAVTVLQIRLMAFLEPVLTPEAYAVLIEGLPMGVSVWIQFAVILTLAVSLEWWLGRWAGFVTKEESWWRERRIRRMCVAYGFLFWFAFSTLLADSDDAKLVFRPTGSFDIEALSIAFFGIVTIFSLLIGKALPDFLIYLTDAPRDERRPRRRGIRLI
ncbi:MAG: hypothetical protein AAGH92_12585 [Planctomycetota bacterium]